MYSRSESMLVTHQADDLGLSSDALAERPTVIDNVIRIRGRNIAENPR